MIKPVILLDLDEVVVSLLDSWLHEYTLVSYEPPRRRDEFSQYDFEGQFLDMAAWWGCIDDGTVLEQANPRPGALDAFRCLNEETDTYLVTYARKEAGGRAHVQKLRWLQKHAPWFDRDKVIFTKHKHLIEGQYMLEDNVGNLAKWVAAGLPGQRTGILINAPWNSGKMPHYCTRAYDLAHAVDMIFRLEGLDGQQM